MTFDQTQSTPPARSSPTPKKKTVEAHKGVVNPFLNAWPMLALSAWAVGCGLDSSLDMFRGYWSSHRFVAVIIEHPLPIIIARYCIMNVLVCS